MLNFRQAMNEAANDIGHGIQYAFYTNGQDGYLFADTDNNGTIDFGIELRELDSLKDFSYADIQ